MSRKVVRVGAFLLVLPLALLAARAFSGEPPKKPAEVDNPFGDGPAKPAAADPFGEAPRAVPDKPKDAAKPVKPGIPSEAKPKPASKVKLRGGEKAILKALKQKTTVDFKETPLKDVVDYLSEKHRIPIILDAQGLKDAGVDPDTQVTKHLSGISLQSALEIILDELQLKWAIHHDVLMITSPQKAESDEFMYTKSYDVADLVNLPSDFATEDNPLTAPGAIPQSNSMGTMIMGQGMAQGAGGGNLGGMGGVPRIPPANSLRDRTLEIREITDIIQNTVATKSWIENGGNGTISPYGTHKLVISQTQEVHRDIEQLLAKLRASRRATPTLNIELHWLWLDTAHRNHLLAKTIASNSLRQIASEVPNFHANVACINGVGTAIAAGDRRLMIVSAIPVVGSGIGYSPVTSMPNIGLRAEIRATLAADGKAAMLFVQSTITRRTPSRRPAVVGSAWPADQETYTEPHTAPAAPQPGNTPHDASTSKPAPNPPPTVHTEKVESGSSSCPIDLPVMPTQEFGTTLRVPLGKPVVVGSVTFAPAGDAGLGEARENPVEVYLIATTSVVKKAKR